VPSCLSGILKERKSAYRVKRFIIEDDQKQEIVVLGRAPHREKLHDLCEQRLARAHSAPLEQSIAGRYLTWNMGELISNRFHNKSLSNLPPYSLLTQIVAS